MKRLCILFGLLLYACAPSNSFEVGPLLTAAAVQITAAAAQVEAATAQAAVQNAPAASVPTTYVPPAPTPTPYVPPAYEPPRQATAVPNFQGDPAAFLRWYFEAITRERNYDYMWSLLTPEFQQAASPGGYLEYVRWWNTVGFVEVGEVEITHKTARAATARIEVTFHMISGQVLPKYEFKYHLVFDDKRATWKFETNE